MLLRSPHASGRKNWALGDTNEKPRPGSFIMILTVILNAILSVGVTVMVVTPLVWATLAQRADQPRPAATDGAPGPGTALV